MKKDINIYEEMELQLINELKEAETTTNSKVD